MKTKEFLFVLILFCSLYSLHAQQMSDYKLLNESYTKKVDVLKKDSLKLKFGANKNYPEAIATQLLIALAHYPELKDEFIKVKYNKGRIAHTSRPIWTSLIIPFRKKRYIITISQKMNPELERTMFQYLSYNAQIGVLGHELAHSVYYKKKSKLSLIFLAFKYSSKKFRIKFENETDISTIHHHLGYQLKDWSKEVHEIHQKGGRGDLYLNTNEILRLMNKQ